jgi:hypothetical protein
MTTAQDCNQFLCFLVENFLNKTPQTLHPTVTASLSLDIKREERREEKEKEEKETATIATMYIYPIKSCAGTSLSSSAMLSLLLFCPLLLSLPRLCRFGSASLFELTASLSLLRCQCLYGLASRSLRFLS